MENEKSTYIVRVSKLAQGRQLKQSEITLHMPPDATVEEVVGALALWMHGEEEWLAITHRWPDSAVLNFCGKRS